MIERSQLDLMDEAGLRSVVASLLDQIDQDSREISFKDAKIAKLTFEMAYLKRIQYGPLSEKLKGEQKELFDEAIAMDLAAIEQDLADLKAQAGRPTPTAKQKPKRGPLPSQFPRVDHHHEPKSTDCRCGCALKRIGEDISEKLDYTPGDFSVERHIRGKWACSACQTQIQAPVELEVIDKGIHTAGLLAQVIVAKYADHLPMYRQEQIFGREGFAIPRSTLSRWAGVCGAKLQPLVDVLKHELLSRTREVRQRIGQDVFREALMELWGGRCALCGVALPPALLRASHAKPWVGSRDDERLDPFNGMLLAVQFDALFDHGLIAFSDEGQTIISSQVTADARQFLKLDELRRLRFVLPGHHEYLRYHRAHVFLA